MNRLLQFIGLGTLVYGITYAYNYLRLEIGLFDEVLKILGLVTLIVGGTYIILRIVLGKWWLPKIGKSLFIGNDIVKSFHQFLDELPKPSKATVATLAGHLIYRFTRLGILGVLLALTPAILLWQQNRLFSHQNSKVDEQTLLLTSQDTLIQNQNRLFKDQNEHVLAQTFLMESQDSLIKKQNDFFKQQTSLYRKQIDQIDEQNRLFLKQIDQTEIEITLLKSHDSLFASQNNFVKEQTDLFKKQISQTDEQIDLLQIQDSLMKQQVVQVETQNELVSADIKLTELHRKSIQEMNLETILSQIWMEGKGAFQSQRELNETTIDRIRRLCDMFGPRKVVSSSDSLDIRYVSPERGLILKILVQRDLNRQSYDNIFKISNFSYADLRTANLEKAYLRNALLNDADLHGAKLHLADMDFARLNRATLTYVDGFDTILSNSKMHEASFDNANLKDANFLNADLTKANFKDVQNLVPDQLFNARTLYGSTGIPQAVFQHLPDSLFLPFEPIVKQPQISH